MEEDEEAENAELDITVLSPHVRTYVETFISKPSFMLSHKDIQIMNPKTSFPCFNKEVFDCDRFLITIPYGGILLECMVIFQSSKSNCPPDFIFSDSRFFIPINQIESLHLWDVEKSDGLLITMKEIMQHYKKRQIQELDKYEILSFEYLCLFQLQQFDEDDIEIFIPPDPDRAVLFLIRLHVDFRDLLPDFYKEESDSKDFPLLLVSFPDRESSKCTQRLYLSDKFRALFSMRETFKLPVEVADNFLTRYIMGLQNELRARAEMAAPRYDSRKLYVVNLLNHFGKNTIEYDVICYTSIVMLLKEDDFHYLVEINLPDEFPVEAPVICFRSVYQTFMGDPIAVSINTYPYSHTWPIDRVIDETVKFIDEYSPLFKQDTAPYICKESIYERA
ncbi:hypothetical protein CDAR_101371 [Caerostris darwini]|uniref:BRISC and BRCA1-A complex member 2 n=1 Tax=Caerostris darwini TaxID=1538125 RepID=A0AAV4TN11_9ARAC|nr:hypothetical protein CDAR_101371 [Caerostris darwini]